MNSPSVIDIGPRIVGLLPDGVSQTVADKVALEVRDAFLKSDGSTVSAVRFLPSTLVLRQGSEVEFVANTTVEPKRSVPGAPAGRSKVIDSVVILDVAAGVVKDVKIPFLERELA